MRQFKSKILTNTKIAPGHFILSFKTPRLAGNALPGQFFNIRVSDSYEPLLRRPFGAHKIRNGKIEILYKVVGKATEILSSRKKGDILDVLGPLGNGFNIQPEAAILVAGGHGVAPLYALAEKLAQKIIVIIGARTKEHVVCEKEFKKLGAKVYVATEDGSKGHKGLVTGLLEQKPLCRPRRSANGRLQTYAVCKAVIYACGPKAMLKAVAGFAGRHGIPCQVSLEEHIACGTGACLGCAVKTRNGYKLVCKDGPVFNAGDIIW